MSAPSSNGRPSVDSQPSITSSPTLLSRNSDAYVDNGEGSSSPRPTLGSRPHTGAAVNSEERAGSASPLSVDSIQEHDFARRKQRVRRTGGFLLDSTFPSRPSRRSQHHAQTEGVSGKRSSRHNGTYDRNEPQEDRSRRRVSPSSSPLLHDEHTDEQSAADRGPQVGLASSQEHSHGQLRVERTRKSVQTMPPASHERDAASSAAQRQTIDPNQLVHMALNLSESRRRNINSGQLLAPQSRITSGAQREGSFSNYGAGSSLRQYLNEQRRASRNISPMGGKNSPSRHMSASMQRSGSVAFSGSQINSPSAATLARVNKARAYIELRIEYLRLLEYLPPLKLDANAPGNFVVSSNNVPGSPQAQLTRVPSYAGKQHDLGRPYNPLQYIRNRRTRARERRALTHSSEEFADIDQVRDWVDRVEQYSKRPSYRRDDAVQLPALHAEHVVNNMQSTQPRPHKGWVFSPEELLADAHWVEQDDNKTLIENRHGRRIFPPREIQKQDFLQPRASKDHSEKRRRSWVDGLPGISADAMTGDESDKGSERGRKRRLLPTIRTESPRAGRHSRKGSRLRTKDDSDSSSSDTDSGKRKPRLAVDTEHNIGPLALLLAQQAKEAQEKSPAIISPDTPDKWGRDEQGVPNNHGSRDSLEVPRPGNGFAYVRDPGKFKVAPRTRMNAALSIDDTEPRSSIESMDTTAPNTPLHPKRFPHFGEDLSPPPSRSGSQTRKSKRSKLNIFHSHEHNGDHKSEHRPGSAGTDKQRGSRQPSEETQDEKHIGTAILAAPGAVRNLLGHRKNDSVSSFTSAEKPRRRDPQEPHSAVTRFFKGMKQERTKVGDRIFRRERQEESDADSLPDRDTVDFDTDTSASIGHSKRQIISRTDTDTTMAGSMDKRNGHTELPPIRRVNDPQVDENIGVNDEHHIIRQTRDHKNSRSRRLDESSSLPQDPGTLPEKASTESLRATRSQSHDRITKVLARPGGANLVGLPPTALRNSSRPDYLERHRSSSRPTLDGKRHWSIADEEGGVQYRKNHANIAAQADIARVGALFLCSGVKAKEISRRAYSPRSPAPDFLSRAAATAKTQLLPVPRKEEHVLAARILVKDLECSTKLLQASLENFRNTAIKELTSQISQLQSCVDSDLMPRVLDGGDKAMRITSEVSGQGPLQVKQITDEIDRMLRARRRRMRWVRGLGWMLVEWAVVTFMWIVWLIVVLVGSVKKVFGIGWSVLRWLLWL